MSADLFPVAGAKIYVGGVLSSKADDFVLADFAGQSWTEIDGWETMGQYGDTAEVISTNLINRNRTIKQAGTVNAGAMQNNFALIPDDAGQIAIRAAAGTKFNRAFKIVYNDAPAARTSTVTMTIAAPGVITWASHGLAVGDSVVFTTTGALPTGLTAGTTYYVKTTPDANTFTVAATAGGSAITTSGSQSGTHIATTVPNASEDYFIALVTSTAQQGGGANTVRMLQANLEINSNIVSVAANAA